MVSETYRPDREGDGTGQQSDHEGSGLLWLPDLLITVAALVA